MSDGSVEDLAERIAARGQDALVDRLRLAFAQAAVVHADVVQVDEVRLEEIVQGFAPRADGLQWRRALAAVAAEELEIDVAHALHHPAVVRAQEIVGAPSYEDSLAALVSRPPPEIPGAALADGDQAGAGDGFEFEADFGEPTGDAATDPEAEPTGDADDDAHGYGEAPPAASVAEAWSESGGTWSEPADEAEVSADEAEVSEEEPADEEQLDKEADADAGDSEPRSRQRPEYPWQAPSESPIEAEPPWRVASEAAAPEPSIEPETVLMPLAEPVDESDPVDQTAVADDRDADTVQDGTGSPPAEVSQFAQLPHYAPDDDEDRLRVTAVHLGGVANLTGSDQTVDLRLSDAGLDILRDEEEIIGRLGWDDIESLEVPSGRGLRRRRGMARAQLVVRTPSGDASFEIPAFTSEELRERIEPLVDRFGRH